MKHRTRRAAGQRAIVMTMLNPTRDSRGSITSVHNHGAIRRLIVVTSKKGVVRGNHYHRKAGHYIYLLSGKLKLVAKSREKIVKSTLKSGSLVWVPPLTPHAFLSLAESVALEYGFSEFHPDDTRKLEKPLA